MILQDIWDSIIGRLQDDEAFRRFFSEFDDVFETKGITDPYCAVGLPVFGPTEIAAITGDPPQMGSDFQINILIAVRSEDPFTRTKMYLKGVEIFINALFKKDVTFGNKLESVPVIQFDEVENVPGSAGEVVSGKGTIFFKLQKFKGGEL